MKLPPHFFIYGAGLVGLASYGTWALLNSTVGYPYQLWFNDMMDSQFVKAYEEPMRAPAEGSVPRAEHQAIETTWRANYDRLTPEGQALTNPYEVTPEFEASGEWAFGVYCAPCHGASGDGQGAVTDNTDGKKRFPVPAVALAGSGAANAAKARTDGYLYLTIRNGGAIMPAYSWALTDEEIWATVHYVRSLEGN